MIALVDFACWEKLTLIAVTKLEFPYLSMFIKTVKALQRMHVCFDFHHIEDPDIQINKKTEFIEQMANTSHKSLVILFGRGSHQAKFLRNILDKYRMLPFFPVIGSIMNWRGVRSFDHLIVVRKLFYYNDHFLLMKEYLERDGHFPTPQYHYLGERLRMEAAKNAYLYFWQRRTGIMSYSNYHDATGYELVQKGRTTYLKFQGSKFLPNDNPFFAKSRNDWICEKPICRPGYYIIYGNISINSFAWKCVLCPKNTHKPLSDDGKCKKCNGRSNIDNGKRTMCIDPYNHVHIGLSTSEFVFLVVLSLLGIFLTLFSLIVFVVKRKTPIVTVSDYKVSLLHMLIISLMFVTTPYTFTGKPNFHRCISRLISISVLYVINIGIVFIKSQKLLKAYLSKIRLTTEEIQRSKIVQVFIIFVFLMSVNTLFAITIYQIPVTNAETLDSKVLVDYHYCNNAFHGHVLIASTMVIQLMCSIQAFRGRNLPSVMNDGIILMYATFTLTIVFGVSFVIVNAQPTQMKELFQSIAVATNNVVIVFLMYTQKALRMILFPEKNTREYFQQERMRERSQDVNQIMEMRS